jgi:RNA polymerase sigma-70 factor (ECF subfamily)
MDQERAHQQITGAWKQHRAYLVDLAFRMLGDIGEAEDVVQEAFSRLVLANLDEVQDQRGWLTVVTSRLSLDHMRSARSRHERAYATSDLDAVAGTRIALPDPADRVTLDDDVGLALLVVLQRMTPAERVVFVLHDVFQMPFDAIAETVGRTAQACRQLAHRARQRIGASQELGRFDVSASEHRRVTEKFITACANGDLNGLLEVLNPDVWGEVDLGPDVPAPPVAVGSDLVARNLLSYWGPGATLVSHPIGDQPALLAFRDRQLAAVLVLTMRDDLIASIHVISDPRKVGFLRSQLAPPA